ncbi:MAG: hypothetical protein IT214_12305 [Chitinophagaceae bacterium]|nr:hypothetical protein [Chitinophagaceae bacterium]
MLKIITSLSFLYALTFILLVWYGLYYYRSLSRPGRVKKLFLPIFTVISIACILFLWINMHAPLSLKTYSNVDHYFIRHDGYRITKSIELGKSDTVNNAGNPFNRFLFSQEDNKVIVSSSYSEDPFYVSSSDIYKLASASFPAAGHALSFHTNLYSAAIIIRGEEDFELKINKSVFSVHKEIKRGLTGWNVFKDLDAFINSEYFSEQVLLECLKEIYFLRDDVSKAGFGSMKIFLSGKLMSLASAVRYDGKMITAGDLSFKAVIPDNSRFAWGYTFLGTNRNQFILKYEAGNSFAILNRFPASYPLSEEQKDNWTDHVVNKFLVSNTKDLERMPSVFREGFLFNSPGNDSPDFFTPVLLSYQKSTGNTALEMKVRRMNKPGEEAGMENNNLILPAISKNFSWIFSLQNTYHWEMGNHILTESQWQFRIFGMLGIFFLMVFFSALFKPAGQISWVWQLLSCISLVFLTTRLFLYWRYKSFPPYDGMDLPSQQQLQSAWNFRIIIYTGIILALFFGFEMLRKAFSVVRGKFALKYFKGIKTKKFFATGKLIRLNPKYFFFMVWLLLLFICYGWAYLRHFDINDCRHISLLLMAIYFIFLYVSYRHSPLVASSEKCWWEIDTFRPLHVLVNNPVKILLSISLLGVFVFIDIGFAIVFLNFILFNEAFLNINYSISGLSAGNSANRKIFVFSAVFYTLVFVLNLLFAPYFLSYILKLPQIIFTFLFSLFALVVILNVTRILYPGIKRRKLAVALFILLPILSLAYFRFIPKEILLDKAERTKYRIDVLTMPPDKAVQLAYEEGKTYDPVIRAAQNQWFINTFIYEKNNPAVNSVYFHLLPQAPQNKGAKYNAQATDLVASRFFIGEHGKWSVLLFVLLLLLPVIMLSPFYKLYPDFTNRTNTNYPTVTVGFTLLNYLLISALLVILAATGKYIFFGQDLPFGSILSKQSILFPSLVIVAAILLFKTVPVQYYSNRKKSIPGIVVFSGLIILLLLIKPAFNRNREFNVNDLSQGMNTMIQAKLQPVIIYFDTSKYSRRMPLSKRDALFADSLRKMIISGIFSSDNPFFQKQIEDYSRSDFKRHLDQKRFLYLDLNSGVPQLAANENYFRIEPPPHLQYAWTGNVFGDTTVYNIAMWDRKTGLLIHKRLTDFTFQPEEKLNSGLMLSFREASSRGIYKKLYLVNSGSSGFSIRVNNSSRKFSAGDSLLLQNPSRILLDDPSSGSEKLIIVEPDAFMKNYFVNGSRYYIYPLGSRLIWARNVAESIAADYVKNGTDSRNAFVSLDFEMMDSLSLIMEQYAGKDSSYKKGAEYGICIADGNGRILAMNDFLKDMARPDPNNKSAFSNLLSNENGVIPQSQLRKLIGNINLLRLNPGPGSTLKPIVFSSVASQLNINWDLFASDGFSKPQNYFGGERVAQYDFEEYHGLIKKLTEYLRLSDNYFHSNVILLGSYPRQNLNGILSRYFVTQKPDSGMHWPYFFYNGKTYWLDGFQNWPGYANGKAHFGTDSSFLSIGMLSNYGIYNHNPGKNFDRFRSSYDSLLFGNAGNRSGFIFPECGLFDQQGGNLNMNIPYDVFANCFRGHVKGSSQVLIPPVKMLEAFGKMVTLNRNYSLTLNPYASLPAFDPFYIDSSIGYNSFLSLMRDGVFTGMKEALFSGTASGLGNQLKNAAPYFYYAKTGTTGDNELKTKSKLLAVVISAKDITNPDYTFKNFNKFFTIYFTSQNGPAKQNTVLQKQVIRYLESSNAFRRLMQEKKDR